MKRSTFRRRRGALFDAPGTRIGRANHVFLLQRERQPPGDTPSRHLRASSSRTRSSGDPSRAVLISFPPIHRLWHLLATRAAIPGAYLPRYIAVVQRLRQRLGPELRQRHHRQAHHSAPRAPRRPQQHLLRRGSRRSRPLHHLRRAGQGDELTLLVAVPGVRRALCRARQLLQRLRQRCGPELR